MLEWPNHNLKCEEWVPAKYGVNKKACAEAGLNYDFGICYLSEITIRRATSDLPSVRV